MEAISGGASVLAFIGIALKSTESVYKTISGIRDAPEKVQRLSSAIEDLQSILRQLSSLFEPPNAARSFDEFESAIRKCESDLTVLSKKLSSLQNSAGDRKMKAAWKRIKAILKKEDMQEMWTTVHHHVTVLGVYLGVLQSFSTVRQMQSISALEQAFQTNNDHVISNTQTLGEQAISLSSLDGRLQLFESHTSTVQQTTKQALDVLSQKIDYIPSLSDNQFDAIKGMLEQLSIQQERTDRSQSNSFQPSSTFSEVDEDSTSDINSSHSASSTFNSNLGTSSSSVLPSITRLCKLVDDKEKTVSSPQAAEIIEDLETLLKTVQDHPSTIAGEKRKRDDEAEIAKSDIKRVKGLLNSAYHVKINNERRIVRTRDSTESVDKRTSKAVATKDGTLFLRTRTRREREATRNEKILEFAADLTFTSTRPELRMKLCALFYQRMLSEGSYLVIPPMLSLHFMIPDNSEIFRLIRNDNLKGVVGLLEQGRASLRDCDTKGRSLLSYASYVRSADICQFLVEHGADVDALEVALGRVEYGEGWESYVSPLVQASISILPDRLPHDCYRILMGAGADVQLPGRGTDAVAQTLPLFRALQMFGENIHSLLNLDQVHVDTEQQNQQGQTPLIYLMDHFTRSIIIHDDLVACVKFLKALGANFRARASDRRTALHMLTWDLCYPDVTLRIRELGTKELIILLIDCGVSIDAVDRNGKTAVERSCTVNFDDRQGYYKDRLLRPRIWRKVLEATGHDPAQFQVLVDAFPDLQRNADIQTSHTEEDELAPRGSACHYDSATPGSGNECLTNEYDKDSTETEDNASHQSSEASLDHDPGSLAAQARTSEPPSPSPSARDQAPADTFWDVIDYAVEQQEGNPWES